MSIQNQIDRLKTAKQGIRSSIEAKGIPVLETLTLDTYPALIEQIQTGGKYQSKQAVPAASQQTVTPDLGFDALSEVTIVGDGNFAAENIKKDVTIWGVTGTLEGGGGSVIPPEAGALIGIEISKQPNKLVYNEGDTFDSTGIEVTAKYENNVYAIVTNSCDFIVDSPVKATTRNVIVKYEIYEVEIPLTVYGKHPEIPSSAVGLFHFEDENGNFSKINSIYPDIQAMQISSNNLSKFGEYGIWYMLEPISQYTPTLGEVCSYKKEFYFETFIYTDRSGIIFYYGINGYMNEQDVFTVRIENAKQISIYYLNKKNVGYTFQEDTLYQKWWHFAVSFYNNNIYIFYNGKLIISTDVTFADTGSFADGSKKLWISDRRQYLHFDEVLICDTALHTSDFTPPTASYGGVKVLQNIYIAAPPDKIIYEAGQQFSLAGAKIMAIFSGQSDIIVTNDCEIVGGPIVKAGDTFKTISYTYSGTTKKVNINIGTYTTEPTLNLENVKLLLPFDGVVKDLATNHTIRVVGKDHYGSLTNGKFKQSIYFDGTENYIEMPYSQDINFDTGDFTIAFWCKPTSSQWTWLASSYKQGKGGFRISKTYNGDIAALVTKSTGEDITISSGHNVELNEWIHLAVVRQNDLFTVYINGKNSGTASYNGTLFNDSLFLIGAINLGSKYEFAFGYIDDFILAKKALWSTDFTPPTKPFSEINF